MIRNFSKTLLTIVVLFGLIAAAPIGATAQESTPTETPTSTPASSSSTSSDENQTEYLIELDENTRVVSQNWEDGTVSFLVESDRSQQLVVTDASIDIQSHEAVNIPQNRQRIPEGRTRVNFSVTNPRDAAITIGTRRALNGLSPGTGGGSALIGGPWGPSDAQAAGVGVGISISIVTFVMVVRRTRGKGLKPERKA